MVSWRWGEFCATADMELQAFTGSQTVTVTSPMQIPASRWLAHRAGQHSTRYSWKVVPRTNMSAILHQHSTLPAGTCPELHTFSPARKMQDQR